ncbi:MAG TPA: hypothetical protein VFP15_10740, partial [Gemmatimonadaceae bacterium]|nr:hypothetical protein [Gemmatimonadaceae bacterium]
MRAFLGVYARAVGTIGLVLLVAALATDSRWTAQGLEMILLLVAVVAFRAQQIPLTKYGALNLLAIPALAGALLVGPPASALAMWVGIVIADGVLLRKGLQAAWINAGREVIALLSSYGVYAWAVIALNGGDAALTTDILAALSLFMLAYFVASRMLLYFTLLIRDKLVDEEKSLILRYEVIAFGASAIAVSVILLTVLNLRPVGWSVVGVVMLGAGLLLKRILEESIAAEELNKILAMEQIVSSDVDIADAFRRIQVLAHRLVDWHTFRISRLEDGLLRQIWSGDLGYLETATDLRPELALLRSESLEKSEVVNVPDVLRDERVGPSSSPMRSVVLLPL